MGCLFDIIEHYIVTKIDHAILMCVHAATSTEDDVYPELRTWYLQLAMSIASDIEPRALHKANLFGRFSQRALEGVEARIDEAIESKCSGGEIWKLARLMANRAGAVKMTTDALEQIGKSVLVLMVKLLRRPMIIHDSILRHNQFKFESEESIDLWNDTPPAFKRDLSDGTSQYLCVIVPGQVEEAANELGITHADGKHSAIYGCSWILKEGQTPEKAIAWAKERYTVHQSPFLFEDNLLPSADNDDYGSLSDTSEENGSFSVFDDDECPDSKSSWSEEESSPDNESSSDEEMDPQSSSEAEMDEAM